MFFLVLLLAHLVSWCRLNMLWLLLHQVPHLSELKVCQFCICLFGRLGQSWNYLGKGRQVNQKLE